MIAGSLFRKPGSSALEDLKALSARETSHTLVLDREESINRIAELDAIIAPWSDNDLLERAVSLKALFLTFSGANDLPLDLLAARNVMVFNTHANAESVAERAVALTLALSGRIIGFHNALARGNWHAGQARESANDTWISLKGKKCSVFGMGSIGTQTARLLKAFGCDVTGFRRDATALKPVWFDRVEKDFGAAVDGCDCAFVTLPLTQATKGIFSRETLASMKGKRVTNVGRGGILDEQGLWEALSGGILAGAAIDTWYSYPRKDAEECPPSRYPIHTLPNVVLSPHVSGLSDIASEASARDAIGNLGTWLRTGTCPNRVDLERGY